MNQDEPVRHAVLRFAVPLSLVLGYTLVQMWLEHSYLLFVLPAAFIVSVLYLKRRELLSVTGFYLALLLASAVPFLFYVLGMIEELMGGSLVRYYFHDPQYIREAFDLVLIQSTVFAAALFSLSPRNGNYVEKIRSSTSKLKHKRLLLPSVLLICLVASVLENMGTTIFEAPYGSEYMTRTSFAFRAWNVIFAFFVSLYCILTRLERLHHIAFLALLVGYWLLFGNRGEVFGIAFLAAMLVFWRLNARGRVIAVAFLCLFLTVFQIVGEIRGNTYGALEAFSDIIQGKRGLFVQQDQVSLSTTAAVAYSLTATVGLVRSGTLDFAQGRTFRDYIFRTLPESITPNRPRDLAFLIGELAQTRGGVHLAGEAFFNFGPLGAYFFAVLIAVFILWLESKAKDPYFAAVALSLVIMAPRVVWYGNIYLYKLLLFCALMYPVYRLVFKIPDRKRGRVSDSLHREDLWKPSRPSASGLNSSTPMP